jgi:hypothetical protein
VANIGSQTCWLAAVAGIKLSTFVFDQLAVYINGTGYCLVTIVTRVNIQIILFVWFGKRSAGLFVIATNTPLVLYEQTDDARRAVDLYFSLVSPCTQPHPKLWQ